MNIFKGLLFLHGDVNPVDLSGFDGDIARRDYGARTAARELAPPLGNRVLSRRWFGTPATLAQLPETGCVTGGCG
jgi:hypothetical protein